MWLRTTSDHWARSSELQSTAPFLQTSRTSLAEEEEAQEADSSSCQSLGGLPQKVAAITFPYAYLILVVVRLCLFTNRHQKCPNQRGYLWSKLRKPRKL